MNPIVKNTGSTNLAEIRNWCYTVYGGSGWSLTAQMPEFGPDNQLLPINEWSYAVILHDSALVNEQNEIWFNLKWAQLPVK